MKTAKEIFDKEIAPKLMKEMGIKNVMAVPRLSRVHVNVGIGTRMRNSKDYSDIEKNVSLISGQKPVVTKARKAISNFKLREGMPNGIICTIRGPRMYDFVSRLVNVTLPRTRDFRGISKKAFDSKGNYSVGIKDCSIFAEVNPDDITHFHGIQINIITTAKNNQDAEKLLRALNFPFKK